MSQFNGLEGRDTFDSSKNYEKVKIINGGIPQNSDLNEQSSIDEERSRNVVRDGHGTGKLSPVDFSFKTPIDAEGLKLLKRSDSNRVGILWQDGNRLSVTSEQDLIIATISTATYKRLKTVGDFKGRVYIVHAKQDYIDASDSLTVRDASQNSSITITTAVREKRVYDFYIDWSVDGDRAPTTIYNDSPILLSSSTGGFFEGKTSFADSPLNGFTGNIFFIGTIHQKAGGTQVADTYSVKEFNGVSDNQLFSGGDIVHRRDTEVSGLIYGTKSSTAPSYDGLKASFLGGEEAPTRDIWTTTSYYSVDYHFIALFRLLAIKATQTVNQEQLHVPSTNNYFTLDSDKTDLILFQDIVEKDGITLKEVIESIFLSSSLQKTSLTVGRVSDKVLRLYVDGDSLSSLSSSSAYKIEIMDSNHSVTQTENTFTICTFRLVIKYINLSPDPDQFSFDVVLSDTDSPSLWDKRTYWINDESKIRTDGSEKISDLETYVASFSSVTGLNVEDVLTSSNSPSENSAVKFSVLSVDSVNNRASLKYMFGDATQAYTGATLYQESDSVPFVITDFLVNPYRNPNTKSISAVSSDDFGNAVSNITYSDSTISVSNTPKTLSDILGVIRGVFSSLTPVSYKGGGGWWSRINQIGMSLPYLEMLTTKVVKGISFTLPVSAIARVAGTALSMLWGTTSKDNNEGYTQFAFVTRTLRDSSGGRTAIITIQGSAGDGTNSYAPMIRLKQTTAHTNHTTAAEGNTGKGSLISLFGDNCLVAVPYNATTIEDVSFANPSGATGVLLDGNGGMVVASLGHFRNIQCPGDAELTSVSAYHAYFSESLEVVAGFNLYGTIVFPGKCTGETLNHLGDKVPAIDAITAGSQSSGDAYHTHPAIAGAPYGTVITHLIDPNVSSDNTVYKHTFSTTFIKCLPTAPNYILCNGAWINKVAGGKDVTNPTDGHPFRNLYLAFALNFTIAGDSTDYFQLPDLRGMFVRGAKDDLDMPAYNECRLGINTGNTANHGIGSKQTDAFKNVTTGDDSPDHTHNLRISTGLGNGDSQTDSNYDDNETGANSHGASVPHRHPVLGGSVYETRPVNMAVHYYVLR